MNAKKRITAVLLAVVMTIGSYAESGYDIMKRVDDRASPSTTHALVGMTIVDPRGNETERVIEQWSAEDNAGNVHSVMVFHNPASVRGTRFLTRENDGRDDDQWIFLPALNRVRRISAGEQGSSFVGTEFSYYDLETRDLDDFTYEYLGTGEAQGYDCHIVESRPKGGVESPYAYTVVWVTLDEDVSSVVRSDIYESEGNLLKTMTVGSLERISGYWTPMSMTMRNIRENRSTVLVQQRIELDNPVDPNRFTQRFLETGRAR